jgi:hypothetical protein
MVDIKRQTLHFIYKHPLFTKTETARGIWYEESVYYLWFEYLKRNEKYRLFCEEQKGSKQTQALYADFGDIHSVPFKQWWRDTGRWLFCEQTDLERVQEVQTADELRLLQSENVLTLAIPLNKNVGWIKGQIDSKIKARRKALGAGDGMGVSTAKYRLNTTPSIPSLIKTLEVWGGYTEGVLSHVRVAKRVKLGNKYSSDESLRTMGHRLYKQGIGLIENVGKGVFPKHNARGR